MLRFLLSQLPPRPTIFPYTTLFRSSLRIESRGQNRNVSSAVLEKPKSYARVKNCRAPSSSRAASSSSVRMTPSSVRSEEHTSELQSHSDLVCRLLLEKKNDMNEC